MSFTNLNEQFHIFSKSPVRAGQTLGSARNKSGHTVTSSDIWVEDIPAFFYAYTEEQKNKFESIASENDLCYDKTSDTLYYYKSRSWNKRVPLVNENGIGEILFNSNAAKNGIYNDGNDKTDDQKKLGVVQYHKGKPVEAITSSNNNESAGNGYTGRIKKDNGTYISQFVSSMDKLVRGNPSSYYEPIILNGSNIMEESSEDTSEKKYIANSYAGIIQFHQDGFKIDETTGNFAEIEASVFEYIGKKLDSTLSNISEDLNSDLSDKGVHVVQNKGQIKSITVTPVTITNGSITSDGDNVISGNQVVKLIDNAKKELLSAGVQYKVLSQSEQLPKASETYKGYIYLMPESNRVSGSYLEYMCVQKEDDTWTWEQIGTTKTDLNGYITDEEFEEHSNDEIIHITDDERTSWNTHKDDTTIHITSSERTSWNNNTTNTTNHINNDDIHITDDERTFWNENVTNSTNHINDTDIHVTLNDKNAWNNNTTNTTNHINNDDIHITNDDKNVWNTHKDDTTIHITSSERTSWNNKISGIIEGDTIINCELNDTTKAVTLSLNVSDNVQVNENTTVPTTQAVCNFYNEFINSKHNISHKFDYNITQKQVKSYQDGTVTFADDTNIQYDIYPATIANYAFRQSTNESLRTLEEFNTREHSGATGTGRNQYFYYERDYYSQNSNGSLKYDDDNPSQGGNAKPLTNLINGSNMFLRSKLSSFNDSLSSLKIGRQMFAQNRQLTEFRSALPSLTYADKMFLGTALTTFRTKLPSLSMAECMFRVCPHLKYIDTCLPNLTFAQGMFGLCINLQRIDLSKNSGISLYNADDMFAGCQSLTHCMLDLSYLETGDNMFGKAGIDTTTTINGITLNAGTTYNNSMLDLESIKYMCETIRDWRPVRNEKPNIFTDENINTAPHRITFGIGCTGTDFRNADKTNQEQYKFWIEKALEKGWDVAIYYSGKAYNVFTSYNYFNNYDTLYSTTPIDGLVDWGS